MDCVDGVRIKSRQFNKETFAIFKTKNNDWSGMIAEEIKRNLNLRKRREFNPWDIVMDWTWRKLLRITHRCINYITGPQWSFT